jgi:hypothetical protein
MLAEMLEYCPAGESTTAVFAFLYLQRLPREIWVLLSEDDPANMRAIAEKADRLIAMHEPCPSPTTPARRLPPRTPSTKLAWWLLYRGLGTARTRVPSGLSSPTPNRRS